MKQHSHTLPHSLQVLKTKLTHFTLSGAYGGAYGVINYCNIANSWILLLKTGPMKYILNDYYLPMCTCDPAVDGVLGQDRMVPLWPSWYMATGP